MRGTGYLRGEPPGVVGQQRVHRGAGGARLDHTAQVEVGDFDTPVAVYPHVGGLEVTV